MKNNVYYKQAQLLLRTIPIIGRIDEFALKGGTAINFFIREMPRLSVDIDLAYLPIETREETLSKINSLLNTTKKEILKNIPNSKVFDRVDRNTAQSYGLLINDGEVQIKIEVNTIIRSSVYGPKLIKLCNKAEKMFELMVEAKCLSLEDIYGGKICAALDRQHPRDLFDIKLLLEHEGITEGIRKAFIVYLISHNRPIVELLNPNLIDLENTYKNEFIGMVAEEVKLSDLEEVREKLIRIIRSSLNENEIEFLLTFKNRDPKWELLDLPGIDKLPSVKWKIANLNSMDTKKHKAAYEKLRDYLLIS